jgi:pantetheine-phosphate adenylyltransferase
LSRRAIYPGSFDPLTNGHLDLIERASRLFDEVIVALLVNPNKQPFFTVEERVTLLEEVLTPRCPNATVETFSGLLVDYARQRQAHAVIRGLRSAADYDYELPMVLMNRHLYPAVETVFLTASQNFTHISSSLVKEVFKLGGDIDALVPAAVSGKMKEKFAR